MDPRFAGIEAFQKIDEIRVICRKHDALIVEDATESLGAKYLLNGKWVETGTLGDYNCISFNGNNVFKIDGDADFIRVTRPNLSLSPAANSF